MAHLEGGGPGQQVSQVHTVKLDALNMIQVNKTGVTELGVVFLPEINSAKNTRPHDSNIKTYDTIMTLCIREVTLIM